MGRSIKSFAEEIGTRHVTKVVVAAEVVVIVI